MTTKERKLLRLTGVLFVITFLTSIPAVLLYQPVLDDPGAIVNAGADTRVLIGAFLEVLLIVANIGTAVALFPVVKRHSEGLGLSFIAARIVESTFIAVGLLSMLAIVTLHQDGVAGTGAIGHSLVAIHDWTFLLGPGFVVGIGNGLILGYLMYRTGIVPRGMAVLGLVGGPLIILSGIGVFFGAFDAGVGPQAVATIPEFLWEGSLGIYLAVTGGRLARRERLVLAPRGQQAVAGEPALSA